MKGRPSDSTWNGVGHYPAPLKDHVGRVRKELCLLAFVIRSSVLRPPKDALPIRWAILECPDVYLDPRTAKVIKSEGFYGAPRVMTLLPPEQPATADHRHIGGVGGRRLIGHQACRRRRGGAAPGRSEVHMIDNHPRV